MKTLGLTTVFLACFVGAVSAEEDALGQEKAFMNFVLEDPVPGEPQYSRSGCLIPEMPVVSNPPGTKLSMAVTDGEAERLLNNIYGLRTREKIVAAGECSCESRFPTWDEAFAEFTAVTSSLPVEEWYLRSRELSQARTSISDSVRVICKAAGVF